MTEERSLKELLAFLPRKEILGNEAVNINKIEYDSRNVVEGDIFVALTGANLDGHDFVPQALEKGARCVVSERPLELPGGVVGVVVADSRHALSLLAAKYYDFPSRKMKVIGITGTNGKSTVAHLVRTIYETNHRQAGLIGTIEYIAGTHKFNAMNTTPESLQIEQLLTIMLAQRIRVCVMEVSSHALKSGRVRMIDFNTVGITNITQDHLDFHHDMEDYKTTKAMIFDKVKGKDK